MRCANRMAAERGPVTLEGIKAHGRIGRGPLETTVYGTDLSVDESPEVGGLGSGLRVSQRPFRDFGRVSVAFSAFPCLVQGASGALGPRLRRLRWCLGNTPDLLLRLRSAA